MQTSQPVAVLAYPEIAESDRAWVEDLRRVEDPEFDAVRPHFTLAFPSPVATHDALLHASIVAEGFPRVTFELNMAKAVPNLVRGGCHVFLVPTVGAEEIEALHDSLYEGPFGPHRLPGVPFIPHMTVGAHSSIRESQALAATVNDNVRTIKGCIHSIDVVEVWAEKTPSLGTLPLRATDL